MMDWPLDVAERHLKQGDRVARQRPREKGRVFLAPLTRGNLQVHWPEGNVVIPRGVCDPVGGVPAYAADVRVEVAGRTN
jgi:hypothetical protein